MAETRDDTLSNLLKEERSFPPPADLAEHANVTEEAYERAASDRDAFWAEAAERLEWDQRWDQVLDWSNPPFAKWFVGGTLNASVNCVDRHVAAGRGDKVAIHWIGEPEDDTRDLTYADLHAEVCKAANALTDLGVEKGDRVAIYMPMIPEVVVAMLACARLGAIHTVVFGGFSADALASRIVDCDAKLVITADGGYRRGAPSALKPAVDEAMEKVDGRVEHVVVVRRTGQEVDWHDERDLWWHDVVDSASPEHTPESHDSEHPLFVMYTSGSTGKPKGILHTTGGYLTGTSFTHWEVFDLKDDDVYWCTADVGWITGHSYMAYGPLANGVTQVMFEGTPEKGRWWHIIQDYKVTLFYTAPTAIRTFMKQGREIPDGYDMSSLRLLGSVGEPINPEAYMWYREVIGGERCPIVDTWWQTETGQIMITPLPGLTTTKPGSATHPFPGISIEIRNERGEKVEKGGGLLTIARPWPAMLRGIYGDPDRYVQTYWSKWNDGVYFAGDGARVDDDGNIWLLGRVDDVLNVSGHRIGTMEVESALVDHPSVAEAAVVGRSHDIKGQSIAAFVTLKDGVKASTGLDHELRQHVVKKIGALARPEEIHFSADLPKTRSGKIMRRLLRDIAEGKAIGDTTTLADPAVVAKLKEQYENQED